LITHKLKDADLTAYKTILIAGPTASGKSGLGIELAKRYNGVIINTDSMQVYCDLRLITARPSVQDEAEAQHRLYGHVDAGAVWSTGLWLRSVQDLFTKLQDEFETLIFVGGTGLYFNALTLGLSEIPETPQELRLRLRAELHELGVAELYKQLRFKDPQSADMFEPQDGQRILRALEVYLHTGRSIREWQASRTEPMVDLGACSTRAIVLEPDREHLAQKIEQRFLTMMEAGALNEVTTLLAQKLDDQMPVMKAIGVVELASFLAGKTNLEDAIQLAVIASRQYAKRQRTWFRGQMGEQWLRFTDTETAVAAI
jgi:tRNA dimethylallyltransferase